uniref:Uncharacterized protein n=1 Tax=Chromera velia CCMP2878 TaxID=1169474 RepID=A0A0G4FHF7_9ALVE|eukprot:Cvel_3308.t1-p1 / transcript=Cvel_3308.t1 / gene=Cvel_3308 / organism=Chromera_velia_CCMP2878 / gene_product=hypothetical protein / transcript_product=hypothetical protein / location=Cvel_scaffold131:49384-53955(+) / protein_length=356 / sequence_SO=supercontig / SO=protein_coding / is_pseudo=false
MARNFANKKKKDLDVEAIRDELRAEGRSVRADELYGKRKKVDRGWGGPDAVGWGVLGHYGSSVKDEGAQKLRVQKQETAVGGSKATKMVKNEKGLWVKVPLSQEEVRERDREKEAESRERDRERGRGGRSRSRSRSAERGKDREVITEMSVAETNKLRAELGLKPLYEGKEKGSKSSGERREENGGAAADRADKNRERERERERESYRERGPDREGSYARPVGGFARQGMRDHEKERRETEWERRRREDRECVATEMEIGGFRTFLNSRDRQRIMRGFQGPQTGNSSSSSSSSAQGGGGGGGRFHDSGRDRGRERDREHEGGGGMRKSGGDGNTVELSVEEWDRVRAELGLKPLRP